MEISGIGVMIEGPSGSGKTSLVFSLLESAEQKNVPAQLITDDQALLENHEGHLIASAPKEIAGKIELFGYGIISIPHKPKTEIDLIVVLESANKIMRSPGIQRVERHGIVLPLVEVPARMEVHAQRIVFAALSDIA